MESEKILLVDDDLDILKVLKANLELQGFEVACASRGKEAIEYVSKSSPDLIILDLMLPDMDGMEVCRRLRQDSPIPVIMLTARDSVSDKVLGLEIGADDYVVKPFETIELVARIKACLRRQRRKIPAEVVIEDLSIDFTKREVKVKGEIVELTPKEYEILKTLISHRGEVLSRDFLRHHVWKDSHLYEWSRVIDVHIQHLRNKIEKDPSNPEYILTVPGAGYRFKD
ncbi:MAG: response regulator transcription factor [Nitrospirota bacterium]